MAQIGTPAEVYEQPNSRFVAEFLGAANVLPAIVRAVAPDGAMLDLPALGACVCARGTGVVGEAVLLAIRPERLCMGASQAPNHIDAVVAERAYAGDTLTHTLRLADGTMVRATQALREGLAAGALGIGERVTLSWQPDACILLRS